jgi:superoxide dismutase, Cu-Zn family
MCRLQQIGIFLVLAIAPFCAQSVTPKVKLLVSMHIVDEKGVGSAVGVIQVEQTKYGVLFTPELKNLSARGTLHGFHVHENASCEPAVKDGKTIAAGSAGAHLDPKKTNRHGSPWGDGHLGDLPPLFIDANGAATQPVLAPRLKLSDLRGRSLMIHAGGDNHSDHPAPLGGGGARIVCGVVPH